MELFTPPCSHFLIVGLKNDIGSAVKTAKETTRIRSVMKWLIPKSVPASQSQGNADANKMVDINSHQLKRLYKQNVSNDSSVGKNY